MGILRLLFAISVVIHHEGSLWGYRLISADMAVRSFFIISGFYMALILREKYPSGNYRLFITNRFLRIYPLYWVVLCFTLIYYFIFNHAYQYSIAKAVGDITLIIRGDYFSLNHD